MNEVRKSRPVYRIIYMLFLLVSVMALFRRYSADNRKRIEKQNESYAAGSARQIAMRIEDELTNAVKTTFLSNMSHDIRTPMNAIIGFATIAVSHMENIEQVKDCLRKILSSGNHLLSLINDILDMSRIESGKLQIVE